VETELSQGLSEVQFVNSSLASDFGSDAGLGIYVHVPFCPHICPYCDFVKTARFKGSDVKSYFDKLELQFEQLIEFIPKSIRTVTLYLGGGTPSLFPARLYAPLVTKIRSRFSICEFTVETNPFTNAQSALKAFAELGVNRITLGAQSMNQNVLSYLGRKHTTEQVLSNLNYALDAGIEQVQVDLIFGLRQLSEKRTISQEIETLAAAGATGASCYLLTIEQSTAFKNEPTALDDVVVTEYESLLRVCKDVGFIQFETSNFSKSAPIHNRLYWYGLPYLGLGTGAHGLMPATPEAPFGRRYSVGRLSGEGRTGDDSLPFSSDADRLFDLSWEDDLRTAEHYREEMILTLLRTQRGIPLDWLNETFSYESRERLWNSKKIEIALQRGSLLRSGTHLSLSALEKVRGDSWAVTVVTELSG
jgi:oxygen-independent coproporphyrinogen-3 oxidase